MGTLVTLFLLMAAPQPMVSCPGTASPELLKVALPSLKATATEIKPWKNLCVALVKTVESEEKKAYAVVLFAPGDEEVSTLVKASSGAISLAGDDSPAKLDLAKYDVTPKQTAIGVRIQRHRIYLHGNEATLETLVLFLPRGRKLEPILDAFMSYEAEVEGERAEDGTRTSSTHDGQATLVISRNLTNGHFDLIRKTTAGTQHLRWDGEAYVAIDDDPFTKDGLDIFDPHLF